MGGGTSSIRPMFYALILLSFTGISLYAGAESSFVSSETEDSYDTSVDYPMSYLKDEDEEQTDKNDIVNPKRGWEAIKFSGKRRTSINDDKRGWEGMDFRFNQLKLPKRGWEGLNFQHRWSGYNSNKAKQRSRMLKYGGRKRGWEGVDTCSCCHSNQKAFCCLACNRHIAYRRARVPRMTTTSGNNMFYVRDTVCKCCYTAHVKDCCDVCDVLS